MRGRRVSSHVLHTLSCSYIKGRYQSAKGRIAKPDDTTRKNIDQRSRTKRPTKSRTKTSTTTITTTTTSIINIITITTICMFRITNRILFVLLTALSLLQHQISKYTLRAARAARTQQADKETTCNISQ